MAGTATITPVHRAVDQAFDSIAFDNLATDDPRADIPATWPLESADQPYFPPPDQKTLETLKPRASVIAYTVQPGDTVVKLAQKYNVTPSTIVWANNLKDPDKLPAGQALLILPMSGVLHTLRADETVDQVADRYQVDREAIVEANGLALDKQLPPATQIVIPGGRPLDPARPETSTRAVERPNPAEQPPTAGAPAATQVAPPPVAIKPVVYEVQDGDSIVSIARRFGVSTGTIALANGISGSAADDLKAGQKLRILPVDGIIHKVGDGQMVRELAAFYGVDTAAIIKANALAEPYLLQPGQEIVIPGGKLPDQPDPAPAPAQAAAQPEATPIPYTVASGDSVVSIAERYGLDGPTLARYNGLDRAELIAPGQNLYLPPGARLASAGAAQPRSASAPAAPVAQPAPKDDGPVQAAVNLVKPVLARPAAPQPTPKPVVASDNWGLVSIASRYLGQAYVWGGQAPGGFDCTGFTWWVYRQAGKTIPLHDLWGQIQSGPRVSRNNLQAGDLVFFVNTYMPGLSHVGIYIGGGRFIHAGSERTGVTVSSLNDAYWSPRYYGASRPW